MELYYFLGWLLRPFAVISLILYSYLTHIPRVRVIVINEKNQILLLKTWLGGNEWGLPGGGVNKGETPARAAIRELKEETGITVSTEQLTELGAVQAAGHKEFVFEVSVAAATLPDVLPDRFEIKDANWFDTQVGIKLQPLTRRILAKWRG